MYKSNISNIISSEGVDIIEDEVINILTNSLAGNNKTIRGIETESIGKIICGSVILTTGTFCQEKYLWDRKPGTREELGSSSKKLVRFFIKNNFSTFRLKTGTPARIKGDSIDFSKCIVQKGT